MYPQRSRMVRQAFRLGLLTLVVLALSACGGGGGGQQHQANEQAKIRGCVPECVYGFTDPGSLPVGSYTTQYFFDGHLTVTFDKPWESHEDQAVEFSVAPLGKWDIHRVLFWSDIYPVEMDNNHELHRVKGVPITTAGWLRWLETNPNLRVTAPALLRSAKMTSRRRWSISPSLMER